MVAICDLGRYLLPSPEFTLLQVSTVQITSVSVFIKLLYPIKPKNAKNPTIWI